MFELSEAHILHEKCGRFPNVPDFAGEGICMFYNRGNACEGELQIGHVYAADIDILASHKELRLNARFLYFCYKGVAGIIFETQKPPKSTVYLTQPRDSKGLFIK